MGHGIAQVFAVGGFRVNLTDVSSDALKQAKLGIKSNIDTLIQHRIITKARGKSALGKVMMLQDMVVAVKDADFVLEAINEDPVLKKQVFKQLEEVCKPDTIFATNSSTISISDLAPAIEKRDRLVGMHWWNPPHLMQLIEVIAGPETSKETVDFTAKLARELGKVPVICKDSPGFLAPRLQEALVIEAIKMVEEGVASPEDIDTACIYSLGVRLPIMGPLRLMDFGGAKVFYGAFEYLSSKLGDRFAPPKLLKDNVEQNKLGIRTGQGIYSYSEKEKKNATRERDEWLIQKMTGNKRRSKRRS